MIIRERRITEDERRLVCEHINNNHRDTVNCLLAWCVLNKKHRTLVNSYETERRYGERRTNFEMAREVRQRTEKWVEVLVRITYSAADVGYLIIKIGAEGVIDMSPAKQKTFQRVA